MSILAHGLVAAHFAMPHNLYIEIGVHKVPTTENAYTLHLVSDELVTSDFIAREINRYSPNSRITVSCAKSACYAKWSDGETYHMKFTRTVGNWI